MDWYAFDSPFAEKAKNQQRNDFHDTPRHESSTISGAWVVLAAFGCEPVAERVVVDGNVITGGAVTAGIDFALTVASEPFGAETARRIQLGIEHAPHPPFDSGTPERADASVVAALRIEACSDS